MPNLKRLEPIVEALGDCQLPIVAEALFGEIARVRSSNQTRTYLNVIIKSLANFPEDMVADRFLRMPEDTSRSPKMRSKFRGIAAEFYPSLRDDDFFEW